MGAYDWAGSQGLRWAAAGDQLEAQLAPVSEALFATARLEPGEQVLDVGCGRGSTTRRAAAAVAPDGAVTGFDVAPNLLEEARNLPSDGGVAINWALGNAQEHRFPADRFDVVLSRFGVMFFDDPTAAFANLARATRTGGRLVIAVWQSRGRSPLMQRSLDVATEAARRLGVELELASPDEGPFSLGRAEVVHDVLGTAGWQAIGIDNQELEMYVSGPGPVADIVDTTMSLGALARALEGADPEVVATVRQAILEDFTPLHDGTGVPLMGAISLVTATR